MLHFGFLILEEYGGLRSGDSGQLCEGKMSQIICTNCHRLNRVGAKFCVGCGSALPLAPAPVFVPPPAPVSYSYSGLGTGLLPANSLVNNRYLIVQKVGQGGMGAVYKVLDMQEGHRVLALKEMSAAAIDPADRPHMVAQFEQEARLLQQLRHRNLPYVTDKFSIDDRHYLVMEFINGRTLQQILDEAQQPLPESLVAYWADQLCDVLAYLHSQTPKIIFRDLKPGNIMVTADNQVKLIDFGIVRFFKPGKMKDTMALGTEGYAAPEQHGTGQTDERSDVYALGATLFHLLTAVEPKAHLFNLPPVRTLNPTVSRQMEQLVLKATRKQLPERFASMQQMRTSLSGLLTQPPTIVTNTAVPQPGGSLPPQMRPTPRPTTRLVQATVKLTAQMSNQQILVAVLVLLALISLGVWFITPRIQGTWFWYYVPTIAVLAPALFAATRRRGVAGLGHAAAAAIAGSLTWYRAGMNRDYGDLFVGALLSALAIEALLLLLPRLTAGLKRDDPGTWKREVSWLGITAVVGHILLTGMAFNFEVAPRPISLFFAFLLGGVGWFVGDSIYIAWEMKQNR